MIMKEQIRQLFESQVYPSFGGRYNLKKKNNGEYASDVLEDHWQTFQEGFEAAVKECANYAFSDDRDNYAMLKHFGVVL